MTKGRWLVLGLLALTPALQAFAGKDLSAEQWREDLRVLGEEFPRKHTNAFHTMSRQQFEAAVERLHASIPSLDDHQVIVELARIANLVQDAHSGIRLLSDHSIGFRSYPIRYYQYSDGVFVQRATKLLADAAGARLVAIGETPIEAALAAVRELVPRENEMNVKAWAPVMLQCPEILHAVGLIDDMEQSTVTLEKNGKSWQVKLAPMGRLHVGGHMAAEQPQEGVEWVLANAGAAAPLPLWLRDPHNSFWFEYLPESKTMYFQVNEIQDKPDQTMEDAVSQVFDLVDARPVDRLVIDIRANGGGNNYLVRPLLRGVIQSRKIDQPGKLFVIIGRRTFSAAQNLANRMQTYTEVTFVGEPTGENVNMYGDTEKFVLPHSGITVRAAYLWWQDMDPRDTRKWTAPDVAAELSSADYAANRDPAMDAILAYQPRPGLRAILERLAEPGTVEAVLGACRAFKADPSHVYAEMESQLNEAGYWLLGQERLDEGLQVLALNAELHPESANAHDSLGEAQLAQGDAVGASRSYKRAAELDPQGPVGLNAKAQLEKIQAATAPPGQARRPR